MESFNSTHQSRHNYPITNLNAYQRHLELVRHYHAYKKGNEKGHDDKLTAKTDLDVIRDNHKFLRDGSEVEDEWESKLALR